MSGREKGQDGLLTSAKTGLVSDEMIAPPLIIWLYAWCLLIALAAIVGSLVVFGHFTVDELIVIVIYIFQGG